MTWAVGASPSHVGGRDQERGRRHGATLRPVPLALDTIECRASRQLTTTGEREEDRRMPTYEYACRNCGEHLEVVQAFTDDALTTCPNCGGPLRKVFGRVGISFKGDGFYKTDSRKTSSASSRSDQAEKSEKSDRAEGRRHQRRRVTASPPSRPSRRAAAKSRRKPVEALDSRGECLRPSAELGVFGGSGFYSFLDDVEEVVLDTPYGPPSSPVAIGEVAGAGSPSSPATAGTTSSPPTG